MEVPAVALGQAGFRLQFGDFVVYIDPYLSDSVERCHGPLFRRRVPIPMREGVTLYADVYRPAQEGQYPVIVSRTPYSTERSPSAYAAAVYFSRRGYVYVFQDVRGRHESEGRWEPFRDDVNDGYATKS